MPSIAKFKNAITCGDCVHGLSALRKNSIDLVFADPPFNIGYEYDKYNDKQDDQAYLDWSKEWIAGVHRVLKPDGTFWLAIGDDYAAELKTIATREVGFHCRSWVIWYYTFGVNCTRKFSRSHTHLFHFTMDPADFTFNSEDIRVPSARQLVYGDKRANAKGRLPDDTWILRPQDLPEGFQPSDDTWYFPRVAGTFKERAGFHGCQMPEQLLGRIIRASSNEGDKVLDPFTGSGSTLIVAKKLNRKWMGFELSQDYAKEARKRLNKTTKGAPLTGSADPLSSAPTTANGRRLETDLLHRHLKQSLGKNGHAKQRTSTARVRGTKPNEHMAALVHAYNVAAHGFSTDRVITDPELNASYLDACARQGISGAPRDWNLELLKLRKSGRLGPVHAKKASPIDKRTLSLCKFASEIAWGIIGDKYGVSLDEILCTPEYANQFDEIAKHFAPGYESFHYRWAGLHTRKVLDRSNRWGRQLHGKSTIIKLSRKYALSKIEERDVPNDGRVFMIHGHQESRLFVGLCNNLRDWVAHWVKATDALSSLAWQNYTNDTPVAISMLNRTASKSPELFWYQSETIRKRQPILHRPLHSSDNSPSAA
jgi:site-specific DNA-methyltransferase (adenine-specific)